MNWRKTKLFIKFHWVAICVSIFSVIVIIALTIFLRNAILAWRASESYMKTSMLAQTGITFLMFMLIQIVTMPLAGIMWIWIMNGGAANFTRLHKKAIKGKEISIGWKDVIGMEAAKQEAMEVVRLITDRTQLQRIGGKILRGILMIGPPGCGKTYMAKAIATEANIPFISMSGSEFVEMYVGVGASRVRKLFKRARNIAESEGGCIIFIDELDAVGRQRSAANSGGAQETNSTLNQLLVEMDGLKEKAENIVTIGATNAPESFLDSALLRPGRFDRKIYVDLPNLEERKELFKYYLKEVKYDESSIDTSRLARLAVEKSPADIANLIQESALIAVRNKKEQIGMKEIMEAIDRIEMGIKHKIVFNEEERKKIAYHEAGHAVATYFLQPFDDVFKISIISRTGEGFLGMMVPHPREELHIHTKEKLLGKIKSCLGSYAAEKLKLGTTTTGVFSDFRTAMRNAHQMVWELGMGKSGLVGSYVLLETMPSGTSRFAEEKVSYLSEKIKEQLNNETQEILQECLKEVEELLTKESALLDRFAQELLAKEELDYDQIEAIFKEHNKTRPSI